MNPWLVRRGVRCVIIMLTGLQAGDRLICELDQKAVDNLWPWEGGADSRTQVRIPFADR